MIEEGQLPVRIEIISKTPHNISLLVSGALHRASSKVVLHIYIQKFRSRPMCVHRPPLSARGLCLPPPNAVIARHPRQAIEKFHSTSHASLILYTVMQPCQPVTGSMSSQPEQNAVTAAAVVPG